MAFCATMARSRVSSEFNQKVSSSNQLDVWPAAGKDDQTGSHGAIIQQPVNPFGFPFIGFDTVYFGIQAIDASNVGNLCTRPRGFTTLLRRVNAVVAIHFPKPRRCNRRR